MNNKNLKVFDYIFNEFKNNEVLKKASEIALIGNFNILLFVPENINYSINKLYHPPIIEKVNKNTYYRDIKQSFEMIIQLEQKIEFEDIIKNKSGKSYEEIKKQCEKYYDFLIDNYSDDKGNFKRLLKNETNHELLKRAFNKLGLHEKDLLHILNVSMVIASMELSKEIKTSHLAEAIQYKTFELKEEK